MDIQNLFPTNRTLTCGPNGEYETEITAAIPNLGLSDFPNAYYLGWIRPENFPDCLKSTMPAIVGGEVNSQIMFPKPTFSSNIPFSYACSYVDSTTPYSFRSIYKINDGTFTVLNGINARFINKFYPEFFGGFTEINLDFTYFIYNPVGELIGNFIPPSSSGSGIVHTFSKSYTVDQFNSFVNGETKTSITYTWTIPETPMDFNFEIDGTEFASGTVDVQDSNGTGYEARIFLTGINFKANYGGNGAQTTILRLKNMAKLEYTIAYNDSDVDDRVVEEMIFSDGTPNSSLAGYFRIDTPGIVSGIYTYGQEYTLCAGSVYDTALFSMEQLADPSVKLLYSNGVLVFRTDNNYTKYFKYYFRIDDVQKMLNLICRVSRTPMASYVNEITFATNVNSNNEFLAELKTGNITNQEFKNGLREWQYVDPDWPDEKKDKGTQVEEFDPTVPGQMPPYEPPGPEPENPDDPNESPEEGDPEAGPDKNDRGAHFQSPTNASFPVNPSPFVEYGIFNYSDLVALCVQLWNKPDSFYEALAGQQKVNPMDYFVSLKWYPFELGGETQKDRLYLGSGGELVANYVQTEELCRVQDWGALRVQPYYNNFLDYDPYTKIFIYLPLCGQVELNSTIVMGKTIELTSVFDVAAGSLVWIVWNGTDGQPVLMKQCSIGSTIPISGVDAAQMSANIVNATLQTINNVAKAGGDIISSARKGGEIGSAAGPEGTIIGGAIGAVAGGISNTTNLISTFSNLGMASKEIVQLTGGTTGLGASGIHTIPAIIYQRPLATNPSTYGETVGFICNKTARVGSMSGFTICKNSNTNSIAGATEKEKAQIKQILDSGFFV